MILAVVASVNANAMEVASLVAWSDRAICTNSRCETVMAVQGGVPSSEVPPLVEPPTIPEPLRFTASDGVLILIALVIVSVFLVRRWHVLRAAPSQLVVVTPGVGVGLAAGMWLLGAIGATIAARAMFGSEPMPDSSQLTLPEVAWLQLAAYSGQSVIVIVYVMLCLRVKHLEFVDRRRSFPASLVLAIVAMLLTWPVVLATAGLAGLLHSAPPDPISHDLLRTLAMVEIDAWAIIIFGLVVIGAPVMEEVMYRGLLQRSFVQAGLSRWTAILITSVGFAVMHMSIAEPHAVAALLVLSLSLGWAYEKSGRLITPIAMHALFNAGNLLIARINA